MSPDGKPLALIPLEKYRFDLWEIEMKRVLSITIIMIPALFAVLFLGCNNKEKIVNSTEYVHDIQYVQSPPDTILHVDTVFSHDSSVVHTVDTILRIDTVYNTNVIHDTVRTTVIVHDTVVTIVHNYDTVVVTDTILQTQCLPSGTSAVVAMEIQTDPLVLDYANQTYGLSDGYIFYLSPAQMNLSKVSTGVYDIYAYLEYYSTDWSQYEAFEIYWRMTYTGGDPNDPSNWEMSDPPSAVSGHQPGLKAVSKGTLELPRQ